MNDSELIIYEPEPKVIDLTLDDDNEVIYEKTLININICLQSLNIPPLTKVFTLIYLV